MGFTRTPVDWKVYREYDAIIFVYVDDILVGTGSTKEMKEIKTQLMRR